MVTHGQSRVSQALLYLRIDEEQLILVIIFNGRGTQCAMLDLCHLNVHQCRGFLIIYFSLLILFSFWRSLLLLNLLGWLTLAILRRLGLA